MAFLDNYIGLDRTHFRSFHLAEQDTHTGARLGGTPPIGVWPAEIEPNTRYLLTIPISTDREVSIFHSFEYEADGPRNPFDMAYQLLDESNRLVQFVVHAPSRRETETRSLISDLPGAALSLSDELLVEGRYEHHPFYPYHKVGGSPVFTREFDTQIAMKSVALLKTHVHLLQLAFPVGPDDAVLNADWPFGDAIFHVFAECNGERVSFLYTWG